MEESAELWAAIEGFADDNRRVHQEWQNLRREVIKRDAFLFAITELLITVLPQPHRDGVRLIYKKVPDGLTRDVVILCTKVLTYQPQAIDFPQQQTGRTVLQFKQQAFEQLISGRNEWTLVRMVTGGAQFEFEQDMVPATCFSVSFSDFHKASLDLSSKSNSTSNPASTREDESNKKAGIPDLWQTQPTYDAVGFNSNAPSYQLMKTSETMKLLSMTTLA
eukprot:14616-Heterococcus_DN1.PRE.9